VLSVTEARAKLIAAFAALPGEKIALQSALGRTLASPLRALRDQPPFAASAMDGYALVAEAPPRIRR
jgi:molybdopterin molybdotransferase